MKEVLHILNTDDKFEQTDNQWWDLVDGVVVFHTLCGEVVDTWSLEDVTGGTRRANCTACILMKMQQEAERE